MVRSTLERSSKAPNCCRVSTLCLMAIHDILLATSLSNPLLSTDNSAIGVYDLGLVVSILFGFLIMAMTAVFKHLG